MSAPAKTAAPGSSATTGERRRTRQKGIAGNALWFWVFVGPFVLGLLIFLPTACSYVVASLIWRLSIFNGVRFGLANTVLGWFGIDNIAWLSTVSPPWYWLPIVTVRLWLQLGFYMILFIAGLQRISPTLYEAAYVDGANPGWQTFRFITLPQLRATSVAVLILNLIAAYQAFDEFYNLVGNVNYAR